MIKKTLNPKWNQSLLFSVSSLDVPVKFTVFDYDEVAPPRLDSPAAGP